MADIRVVQVAVPAPISVVLDWIQTPDGMLDEVNELATAVIVALATDARAGPSDDLPDLDSDDRRGWWGNLDAAEIWGGWPLGSRLWLMERAKITDAVAREGATVARIENYIREAIRPFIDAKIASQFTVQVVRSGRDTIAATLVLYRGPLPAVQLRFQSLWDGIGR